MKRTALLIAVALPLGLGACGSKIIYRDRIQTVNVPVAQPCAGVRPAKVASLKVRTPDWQNMDVRQKAAATGQWSLDQLTYGQKLDAATAGCP